MCVNVHRLFTFSTPTTKLWLSSLSSILNCSNLFQTEENLIVIHHCIKENWQMPVCYYLRCLVKYWKCHKCVIMLAFHVKKNSCIHNKNDCCQQRLLCTCHYIYDERVAWAWWVDVFVWRQYDVVLLLVRSFLTLFFAILYLYFLRWDFVV